jgi:hypothetical protein
MADSSSVPIRLQLRSAVLAGGGLLREAAAGLREGLEQLQAMPAPSQRQLSLERELEQARCDGRWLSDGERQELLEEQERLRQSALADQQRRRSLLILLVVSLLLPPFWPLAIGLTAYLLFPRTTRRLTLVALALSGVGVVLLIALLVTVLMALF